MVESTLRNKPMCQLYFCYENEKDFVLTNEKF